MQIIYVDSYFYVAWEWHLNLAHIAPNGPTAMSNDIKVRRLLKFRFAQHLFTSVCRGCDRVRSDIILLLCYRKFLIVQRSPTVSRRTELIKLGVIGARI